MIASRELTPTVFIVDDDPAMRKSLSYLIESVDLPVESYESAAAFLAAFEADRPGCLILDVRMPGMGGLDLQDRLRAMDSQIPVILVTGYGNVPMAVRAMRAGAVDFLEKPVGDQVLIEHVQHAIERDLATRVAKAERDQIAERIRRLTPRERQVMRLVVDGYSSKEVAVAIGISFKTVEAHRAKIMKKMQAKSVPHLIRMNLLHAPGERHDAAARTA